MSSFRVVVGRQPIFDRNLSVMGYELLFRTLGPEASLNRANNVAGFSGDLMTAEVLFGSVSIGIERLVGDKKVFLNASRGVLTGEVPLVLPPEQTVIEVLETVEIDDAVLAGCRELSQQGFALALDDFTWFPGAERLLDLASIVKIDLRATRPRDLAGLVRRCREFDVTMLAEKVETTEELHRCQAIGFDLFQGYLLARTRPVPGRALDPSRQSQLRLSSRLLDSECPVSELESIIRSDPAMVYQILQLAGIGAAGNMRRPVRTLREALVLVGWRRLQSWVSLLLVTEKGDGWEENITLALTRARMCELVASATDRALMEPAFTAGMLSCFGTLLGMSLQEVIGSLPLHDDLRKAVLSGAGPLGRLLADVSDYLLGRPEEAVRAGFGDEVLAVAALEALTWAVGMTTALAGEPAPV